jgi:antitoxin MazE
MTTKIQKWGNSLAVRIPKIFAQNLNWKKGTTVYFEQVGNAIFVASHRSKYTLENMVKCITKKNRHKEINWGPSRGKEIW